MRPLHRLGPAGRWRLKPAITVMVVVKFAVLIMTALEPTQAKGSVDCPKRRVFRDPGLPYPRSLLYSMEGSGNTWMRFLLENTTGVFSGAIYTDPTLRWDRGFEGEGTTSNAVIAVKSHKDRAPDLVSNGELLGYDKLIHLVRNPFDALVAERKRRLSSSHESTPPWKTFVEGTTVRRNEFRDNPFTWDEWLQEYGVPLWLKTIHLPRSAMEKTSVETIIVKFEDLRADTETALRPVLTFLEYDPDLATCLADTKGRAKRASSEEYPVCVYTRKQLEKLLELFGPTLSWYGYSVPTKCKDVLDGTAAGGTDALAVN